MGARGRRLLGPRPSPRLTASRNVFGNLTPTLYALLDVRYLYRTDL